MLYEYFFKKSQRKKKRKKGNGGGGWFMKYCFVLTILTKTVQFWLVFIQSDRSNYHKGETLEKWLKHKSICKPLLLLGLYISRILLTSNPRKYLLLMYLDFLFSFFQSNQVHSSRVIKWGYFFLWMMVILPRAYNFWQYFEVGTCLMSYFMTDLSMGSNVYKNN